jgi:hypothetical protein
MRHSTAYNHYCRLRDRLDSIHRTAIQFQHSHAVTLEATKAEIWGDPALKKCPSWVQGQLSIRGEMWLKEVFRYWLVWLFPTPSGPKDWDSLTDAERDEYRTPDHTGAHYWLKLDNVTRDKWLDLACENRIANARYIITDKVFS